MPRGWTSLTCYLAILAVTRGVRRRVAQNVLIAQFHADLGGHVGQFVQIVHLVLPPSGLLGDLGEHAGSGHFLRCAVAAAAVLVESDGVDLHVGFLHQRTDFRLAVTAAVIPAIGDQQQGLARILRLLHFVQRHVNRIQQGGPALGLGEGQLVLNLLQVARETLYEIGGIVELHQEKLVFRIGQLEELRHRLPGFFQFVAHAAAAIEDHPHR